MAVKQEEGEVVHIKNLWDVRPFDMIEPNLFVREIKIGGADTGIYAAPLCVVTEPMVMPDGRVEHLKTPRWGEFTKLDSAPYYVRRGVTPPTCPSA